ncbi:MAG: hypothetical protein DRQ10_01980, partial [Candidatus Hydrothermota bacterium]
EEARRLLEQLRSSNSIPPNEPPLIVGSLEFYPYSEEYLRDQGVPIETESDRKVLKLIRPVKEFALNPVPSPKEIQKVFPALKDLYKTLLLAKANRVNPKVAELAWNYLAASCACIAGISELPRLPEIGNFVYEVLLEASDHPIPKHEPEKENFFDEHPNIGSLAPRLTAAYGLMFLSRIRKYATPKLLDTIKRLSKDSVPAVRFQIASNLYRLFDTARDFMWKLIEHIAAEEKSYGVLWGLLAGPLLRLSWVEPERVAKLTKAIFDRVEDNKHGSKSVREVCIQIFTNLYVWQNQPLSREKVYSIISSPFEHSDEAQTVLTNLRTALTYKINDIFDTEAAFVRQRARNLLQHLFQSAWHKLKEIERRYADLPPTKWPQQLQDKTRSLMGLVEGAVREVYFASGAHDAKEQGQVKTQPSRAERIKFYNEFSELLDEFAETGLPNIIHYLVETLEFFIPINRRDVFLKIARAVKAGEREGYQYEPLAVDLIVKIISRYLADYRNLLQKDAECQRALIDILDIFVKAGWPKAWRVAYRLEEIFR